MAVTRYRDLITWQLADQFKSEVIKLVKESPEAWRDLRFRSQILESARAASKNIAEGFMRRSPRFFANFIDYHRSLFAEAEEHLKDGIELGYFQTTVCENAFRLAKRCTVASIHLKISQLRYAAEQERLTNRARRS